MAVGYDNLSYFHRIFQKRYGMTPRKYRVDKTRNIADTYNDLQIRTLF